MSAPRRFHPEALLLVAIVALPSSPPAEAAAEAAAAPASALQAIVDALGPDAKRREFAGVVSVADASGPRGAFTSEMLSLDDGTALFRLTRQGEVTELLLADGGPFHRDRKSTGGGGDLAAGDAALVGFVRGHEIH